MTVAIGTRIAHYEITGWLGAGGMGEVYRARDLKLGRDVAVKVLSGSPAPDDIRRFQREATLLATLNYPHIAQIYGIEEAENRLALILELVDGESLDQIIAATGGAGLPVDRVLAIADQVAGALEEAHAKGIVHRDLKPANIKVTPAGMVKVLDFGIAITPSAASADDPADEGATRTAKYAVSTVAGTVPYMSPEQALGRMVDARSDIWAFGCVLFEMLAGRHPFAGSTSLETIAAIVERQPDWNALPATVPPYVTHALRGCLEKDPARRLPSIGEARRALKDGTPRWSRRSLVRAGVAVAAAGVLLTGATAIYRWTADPPALVFGKSRQLTTHSAIEDYPTAAPDGRTIAYESNQLGTWDIWVTAEGGNAPVNRTRDHAGDDRYPSWSPDGSQIAFWSDRDGGGYYVMPAIGGPASRVYANDSAPSRLSPAAWSPDGTEIGVVSYRVDASKTPTLAIVNLRTRDVRLAPLPGSEESRLDLAWSPDGRFIAYLDAAQQPSERTRLRTLRLSDGKSFDVTDARANARSPVWARDSRSLYFVWNTAGAADLWRRRVSSEGVPQEDSQQVTTGVEVLHATLTQAGNRLVLAKGRWVANVWRVPISPGKTATWKDAQQVTFEQAFIEFVDVHPLEHTLAFSSDRSGNQDLWTLDLSTGRTTQITSHDAPEWAPRWSPDGRRLAFYSTRTGDREIYVMGLEGGDVRQLTHAAGLDATPDWSPNGQWIAFRSERTGTSDIWVVSEDGRQSYAIAPNPEPEYAPTWSPDGRWIAFGSRREGRRGLWRVPFPKGTPQHIVDGSTPRLRWSRADRRIYYVGSDGESTDIWSIDPDATAPPARVVDLAGRRGSLGTQPPCPTKGFLYFTWREDPADIWMMDVAKPSR